MSELVKLQKAELVFQVIKVLLALYFVGVSLIMLDMMRELLIIVGNM